MNPNGLPAPEGVVPPETQVQWHLFLANYADKLPKVSPVRAQMNAALASAPPPDSAVAKAVFTYSAAPSAAPNPTAVFQKAEGLTVTGELDAATRAVAAVRYNFGTRQFRIGPDRRGQNGNGDLREQRPYFLVPLDEKPAEWENLQTRIVDHVRAVSLQNTVSILRRRDIRDWKFLTDALADAASAQSEPAPDPDADKEKQAPTVLTDVERMARHLCRLFTPDTVASLRVLHGAGRTIAASGLGLWPLHLRDTLLAEINDALTSGRLDVAQNDGIAALAPEPEGIDRLLKNRQALEDAFPSSVIERAWRRGPVTDIFVMSHGWHRNFLGAVAAYDRVASRIALLMHRERFAEIRRDPPFHPLFLMLHWHSDPGQNGWVDKGGRREKTAFLETCQRLFDRPNAHEERDEVPEDRFSAVFEEVYALFSDMSAPDTLPLEDEAVRKTAELLAERLDRFYLRDAPSSDGADKAAAVWAAYHTSPAQRPLANQGIRTGRFVPFVPALLSVFSFIGKAVGVVALGGLLLPQLLKTSLARRCEAKIVDYWNLLYTVFQTLFLHLMGPLWPKAVSFLATTASACWILLTVGFLAYLCLLPPTLGSPKRHRRDGVNFARLLAFVCLLLPCALPLLGFLFFTYFTGPIVPTLLYWVGGLGGRPDRRRLTYLQTLFDERIGSRNEPITQEQVDTLLYHGHLWPGLFKLPRYHLARLARWPVRLIRAGLAKENPGHPLIDMVDNQFAFWEMQIGGAQSGRHGAHFLTALLSKMAANTGGGPDGKTALVDLNGVRVHLMGHSFGGLLVCSLLRHLVLDPACRRNGTLTEPPVLPKVESVILLEAAVASTWFEFEEKIRRYVRGGVGCIYSAYDTANGFYYPVANNARQAAGYVGLYWMGGDADKGTGSVRPVTLPPPDEITKRSLFSALIEPPPLRAYASDADPQAAEQFPLFVNLDASRVIFDGPAASGGGHGDIFKDDVMHLCWAITQMGEGNHKKLDGDTQ